MIDPKYNRDLLRADAIRELDRIDGARVPTTFAIAVTPKLGNTASKGDDQHIAANLSGTRGAETRLDQVADRVMRPHVEAALAEYRAALQKIVEGT